MTYLKPIARLSGTGNIGGIVDIKIARKDDVISMPAPVNGVIYDEIIFKPERGWITWLCTSGSAGFSGRSKDSQEGPYKDGSLPFYLPKNSADIFNMLKKAEKDTFIVLFRDANNKRKVFGNLEAPVFFKFDVGSGKKTSNINGYDCEFYSEVVDNIAFYQEDLGLPVGIGATPCIIYNYRDDIVAILYPGENYKILTPYFWEGYIL